MTVDFYPLQSATRTIAATSTSVSIALPSLGANVMVQNLGSSTAYVRFAAVSPATAIVTDHPIVTGTRQVLKRDPIAQQYMAAVTDTGTTATLKVSTGSGD